MSQVQFGKEFQHYSYFQFMPELNHPVYVRCILKDFGAEMIDFFAQLGLVEVADDEKGATQKMLDHDPSARILTLAEAGPTCSRQIAQSIESDYYGKESIVPGDGYSVYRYKDLALMVFSMGATEWNMGCFKDFANKENTACAKIVINRYLGQAISSFGLLGLWGNAVEDGVVILSAHYAEGEAVYIDIKNRTIVYDGLLKKMASRFKLIRLDRSKLASIKSMSEGEVIGYIARCHTFFDDPSISKTVSQRQMIQALAKIVEGRRYPQENFRPRQDLSL